MTPNYSYLYYCLNRKWYHYWERLFHKNNDRDALYSIISDSLTAKHIPLTICDLYCMDRNSLPRYFGKLCLDMVPLNEVIDHLEERGLVCLCDYKIVEQS